MNSYTIAPPANLTVPVSCWLVLKGYVLRDGFPGMDCAAIRADARIGELTRNVAAVIRSERDHIDIIRRTSEAYERATGKMREPRREQIGLRAYLIWAESAEAFYRAPHEHVTLKPILTSSWMPTQSSFDDGVIAQHAQALTKQLGVLLEERSHL